MSLIWAYAGAAALASQRQPTLAPEALSKAKPGKSPPLSLDQINKVYDNGHPSNKVSAGPGSAGLVVHMYDLTERVGTGQMYQPGDAQFQKFWATSIVNRNMPGTYEPPTGGGPCNGVGILINPEAAKVLCSCAWDFTSWNSGCAASSDLYTPDKLEAMLNVSSQKQADPNVDTFGGKYNEVIIDSAEYRDQLPTAIAAVFFTQEPDCATRTHRMIVDSYGIDPGQVLLLEHAPGASPGFKVHTPAKGEGEPDETDVPAAPEPEAPAEAEAEAAHPDWECEQPATWCVHAGATNAYRKCGGLPGHFCEDSEGNSGFYSCDQKVEATWGTVECAAKGEKQQTTGQGAGQQSLSKEQSPGDEIEICPKPADWCAYAGATNEPKECGGQLGHFCHDIFGKSGFAPCDAKQERSWGTVTCQRPTSEENVKRSQRRRAPVQANWWAAPESGAESAAEAASGSREKSAIADR